MIRFLSKLEKKHFWVILGLLAHFWANENFPEKLGSVTFQPLWIPNFMQKIEKTN